jgi:hypothetical protein
VAYDPPADVFVWLTRLVASSWFRTIQARGSIPKRSERHIGESTHIGDGPTPKLGEMEEWRSGGPPSESEEIYAVFDGAVGNEP